MGRAIRSTHDIQRLSVGSGQIALCPLGQAGFLLYGGELTLLIDPFLGPHPERRVSPPIDPQGCRDVNAVLCTHEHDDHLDPATLLPLAEASPQCQFIVPGPVVRVLVELGIAPQRIIGALPGRPILLGDCTITGVPAVHALNVSDGYTTGEEQGGDPRFLGYVIEVGGVSLYHAGDTLKYDGMGELLRRHSVDVALLPINGRDAGREARNIAGNMGHEEAAELASEVGADLVIPMHHDMFRSNPGFPERLLETCRHRYPGLTLAVPALGHPFIYTKPRET